MARALLAQFLGVQPQQITLSAPRLLQLPPEQSRPRHWIRRRIRSRRSRMLSSNKRRPSFRFWKGLTFPGFLRRVRHMHVGQVRDIDGTRLGGLNGLAPDTQNYALGFSVTFPPFDLPSIRAREAGQSARSAPKTARYQQITTDLTARWNAARGCSRQARGELRRIHRSRFPPRLQPINRQPHATRPDWERSLKSRMRSGF